MGRKRNIVYPMVLGLSLIISGCTNAEKTNTAQNEELISSYVTYDDEDSYKEWDSKSATFVDLNDTAVNIDGEGGVVVEGGSILIRTSGTYVFEGSLNDGQIVVDAEDSGTVRLVLNGVNVKSSTSAPVYIKQADKTVISLEENTKNTLIDAKEYVYEDDKTDEPNAAIFSNDDLTINGKGLLVVQANYQDGIKSDDSLKLTGGYITVTSTDDGIVGRDLLAIKDSTITLTTAGDGLKATNDEDNGKGNIVIESGSFVIDAKGDGIQAAKDIAITDGEYTIKTGGGSPETIQASTEFGMGGPGKMDGNFDVSSMIDRMLEGVDVPEDVKQQLESAETFEDIVTILEKYPDIQQQIQQNRMGGSPNMNGEDLPTNSQSANNENSTQPMPNNEASQGDMANNANIPETNNQSADKESDTSTAKEDTVSTKGLKAQSVLTIAGGTLKIDSLEDAVHSNQNVSILGGIISAETGDDGIHADSDVLISGGDITINKSYEGLEGKNITISDGTIHIVAVDDGVNINSTETEFGMVGRGIPGNSFLENASESISEDSSKETEPAEDEGILSIEGGYIYVNADGDGLDSNNSIKMTDGFVIVYGPTNSGNAPLDYNSSFIIEGGTLIAAGSSGMAQGVSEESTQNAVMVTFDEMLEAGSTIYLENSKGDPIVAAAPEKSFQSIVISTPELNSDESYKFSSGGSISGDSKDGYYANATYKNATQSVEFTLSTVMTYLNESGITDAPSGGMGGFGGGPRSGMGSSPINRDQNTTKEQTTTEEQ